MLSDPMWFPTSCANVGKPWSSVDDFEIFMLWISFSVHFPHQFLGAGRVWRFNPVFLFPGSLHFECFPVASLENIRLDLGLTSASVSWCQEHRFFSTFSRLTGLPTSCGGFFLALNKLCNASCPLFEIALCFLIGSERNLLKWLQENIEKFMMLNKRRRWFYSSRVKLPLVYISASWVFGVNIFHLDFGFQIDSVEQPVKSNSVGSGNMSHCRASSRWWSSWSQLRHLQRCTTQTHLEKVFL